MVKKNDDFFAEKKPWSKVKDALLGCYFQPYVQKILCTRRPLIYIDCFAGKGKFDDGEPGSPIIALDIINECLAKTNMPIPPQIEKIFIDLNYANDLQENLKKYNGTSIISGKYEEKIDSVLTGKNNFNVFLYIDPYGIKALDCSKFDELANGRFNSIELLINMNSFGFLREGCRVLGGQFSTDDNYDDLVEYEPSVLDISTDSIEASKQLLNKIAGGEYWVDIVEKYKNHQISGYEAEELFSKQYCQRLSKHFPYVLNMPIRLQRGQHTKYRMIHATKHKDGCLLMVDNICNRWELLRDMQNSGQLTFFNENVNNEILNDKELESKVISHFSQYNDFISLDIAVAKFFVNNGVMCSRKDVANVLLKLEKNGKVVISRTPNTTKNGRPSTFMQESKDKKAYIKWGNQ